MKTANFKEHHLSINGLGVTLRTEEEKGGHERELKKRPVRQELIS